MKPVLVLLVLLAVGGVAVYYLGGYHTFDPSKQGLDAKAAITPGTSYKTVLDIAGDPQEYRVIHRRVRKEGKEEIEFFELGAKNLFNRDTVADRVAQNGYPHGFTFGYVFSNSVAFRVTFDENGDAKSIEDMLTMADLLQTKD